MPKAEPSYKRPGFDVTCTIGRVEFHRTGGPGLTPYQAAFRLIAEHGADGRYTFPSESEGMVHVHVETEKDSLRSDE